MGLVKAEGTSICVEDYWDDLFKSSGEDPWSIANKPGADKDPRTQSLIACGVRFMAVSYDLTPEQARSALHSRGVEEGRAGEGSEVLMGVLTIVG